MDVQNGAMVKNHELLGPVSAFVNTVEYGSFSNAGKQLGISGSAVGKSVERLEKKLGARLLHRSTRGFSLTQAGRIYFKHAQNAIKELEYANSILESNSAEPRGRIKVSLPHNMGNLLTATLFKDFSSTYSDIILDIQLEDAPVDVIATSIDIVIRTGLLPDSSMIAVRIAPQECVICGSTSYFKHHPIPKSPENLRDHKGIFFRQINTELLFPWSLDDRFANIEIPPTMVFNNSAGVLSAVRAGIGLGQLPRFVALPYIQKGELIPVLGDCMTPRGDIWIAWASNRQRSVSHKLLVDYLKDKLPRALDLG